MPAERSEPALAATARAAAGGAMVAALALVAACTSVRVRPMERAAGVKHVCIESNPKVIVSDFVPVVRDGFARHGISTEVFSEDAPVGCEYVLTYTALRSWDFAPYLSHAELHLLRQGEEVAQAEYHLKAKGGWSLMKWQGTRTKMDPVIDELLKEY
jgi:hypothetical protein